MFCQLEKRMQKDKMAHKKPSAATGYQYANRMPGNSFLMRPGENNNFKGVPCSNAPVIQRESFINYINCTFEGDIQHNSQIVRVGHVRVNLRQEERNLAYIFSAGANCNHHAPYFRVSNAIINNWLIGRTVENAIIGINGVIAQLNTVGNGFARIPRIEYKRFGLEMSKEFDDAIANIANDPRNLFYSAEHRGDAGGMQLDWPVDHEGNNLAVGHYMFDYSRILIQNHMC